jgi:hypothetical protein
MLIGLLITAMVWTVPPLQIVPPSQMLQANQTEELMPVSKQSGREADQPTESDQPTQVADAAELEPTDSATNQPPASENQPTDSETKTESDRRRPTNTGQEGLRRPFQDDILRSLLKDREAAQTIPRQDPGMPAQPPVMLGSQREISGLMPDGTSIVERPGRFYRTGEQRMIELRLSGGKRRISLEVLPNALLEAVEREVAKGVSEFTISGELTRYGTQNYLLLRKVVQRVDNGNLAP